MPQRNARNLLGSLTAIGGVDVNGAAVSTQSLLYAGDTITTNENGTAKLSVSGRGEFEIGPLTQIVFSDSSQYAAQLYVGTVGFDTLAERSNLGVRTGDYVVTVPPDSLSNTSATVRRTSDGSALVSCARGNVQIVALEGDTSLALRAGQSTSLAPPEDKVVTAVIPGEPILGRPVSAIQTHRLRTVLIIGAAAAVVAVIIATHHSGGPSRANVGSPYANTNANSHSYPNSDSDANANSHSCPNSNSDAHTNSDADSNANPHSYPNPNPGPDADPHSYPSPGPNSDSYPNPNTTCSSR